MAIADFRFCHSSASNVSLAIEMGMQIMGLLSAIFTTPSTVVLLNPDLFSDFQIDLEELFLDYDVTRIRLNSSKTRRLAKECNR